jgi:hypothetical protein
MFENALKIWLMEKYGTRADHLKELNGDPLRASVKCPHIEPLAHNLPNEKKFGRVREQSKTVTLSDVFVLDLDLGDDYLVGIKSGKCSCGYVWFMRHKINRADFCSAPIEKRETVKTETPVPALGRNLLQTERDERRKAGK